MSLAGMSHMNDSFEALRSRGRYNTFVLYCIWMLNKIELELCVLEYYLARIKDKFSLARYYFLNKVDLEKSGMINGCDMSQTY